MRFFFNRSRDVESTVSGRGETLNSLFASTGLHTDRFVRSRDPRLAQECGMERGTFAVRNRITDDR
jgi:hypothetical protein